MNISQKKDIRSTAHDNSLGVVVSTWVRACGAAAMFFSLVVVGFKGFAADVSCPGNNRGILDYLKIAGGAWDRTCSNGTPTNSVGAIVGSVIQVFLGFLGIIFLILTLYAGYLWMTAGGNDKEVQKAKDLLISAVTGLIIIIAAQGLTYWLLSVAAKVVTGTSS